MLGQMKIFHVGSHQFSELLRELWFSYCSSRGMSFREWNFVFQEWNFEFRELLREYPRTLRELREWPFHSESVFHEIGVVPRLLIFSGKTTTINIEFWFRFGPVLPWVALVQNRFAHGASDSWETFAPWVQKTFCTFS